MVKKYLVKGAWTQSYIAKDEQTALDYANKVLKYLNNPNIKAEVLSVEEVQL
jgi:hypothetical protein